MPDDFTGLIPESAVVLNVIRIVEYMDEDGALQKQDFSYAGDGDEVPVGKALELIEWCRAFTLSGMYMAMVHEFILCSEDEDEDD
jgi:hypothetical protein